jgi:hypothetical protein
VETFFVFRQTSVKNMLDASKNSPYAFIAFFLHAIAQQQKEFKA